MTSSPVELELYSFLFVKVYSGNCPLFLAGHSRTSNGRFAPKTPKANLAPIEVWLRARLSSHVKYIKRSCPGIPRTRPMLVPPTTGQGGFPTG